MASKRDVALIVRGAGLLTSIFSALVTAVQKRGGTEEQIHALATPEGETALAKIADIIAGKTAEVTAAVQVAWSTLFTWLVGLGRFTYVNLAITAENFPCQPGDFVATMDVVIVKITKVMSTKAVLALLDEQGLRPATLVELLWWWITHPKEQSNCLVVALGSVWGSFVPYVYGSGDDRKLILSLVERVWDEDYAFAGVRKSKAA